MVSLLWIFLGLCRLLELVDCQGCIQSSTFNYKECQFAIDGMDKTCSQTGFAAGAWWKYDFNSPRKVSQFKMKGNVEYFEVRVGNNSDSLGLRAGFATNHLCLLSSNRALGIKEGLVTFYCDNPIYGRFFSVQLLDPCNPASLLICDIQFI